MDRKIFNYRRGEINNNNKHKENNDYRNINRKKKIRINLPLCKLSTIRIGKYFKNLIDKHFNHDNPLSKIFSRNTIKIRYSCTNNISKIIYNRNRK